MSLLFGADTRARALALELVLRVAYYGRGEVLDALLAEGLVKPLLCLQPSDLGAVSATDSDASQQDAPLSASRRPFVSAVARFAVQVEVDRLEAEEPLDASDRGGCCASPHFFLNPEKNFCGAPG